MFFLQQSLERFGLRESPWETIEDEAVATMEAGTAFANHFPDGDIGDESATPHVFDRLRHGRTEFATTLGGGTKNVTRGKVAGLEFPMKHLGLRSFADSRRA